MKDTLEAPPPPGGPLMPPPELVAIAQAPEAVPRGQFYIHPMVLVGGIVLMALGLKWLFRKNPK